MHLTPNASLYLGRDRIQLVRAADRVGDGVELTVRLADDDVGAGLREAERVRASLSALPRVTRTVCPE